MTWQDELPPIPAERMLSDVVGEGTRRLERRRQKRRRATYVAGLGAAAALLLLAGTSGLFDDDAADDASFEAAATEPATEDTTTGTEAAAATIAEAPAGTEAFAAETTAAAETTIGEAASATTATATEGTTAGTAAAAITVPSGAIPIRPSSDVVIEPLQIWEQPADGPACGPTTVEVRYEPRDRTLVAATLLWAGPFGIEQALMTVVDNVARATIGPFTPGTVTDAQPLDVFVAVMAVHVGGRAEMLRAPVEAFGLHGC